MIELITVIAFIAIISATAVSNLKVLNDPLADASFTVSHYLRLARARAISQTQFVRVVPVSTTDIGAQVGTSCDEATTPVPELSTQFPKGSFMNDIEWEVCFTPRGLSADNLAFLIRDVDGHTKTVEVALGGGVRIQ